jgi:hypothetical protein
MTQTPKPIKLTWQDKVKQVDLFHRTQLKDDENWTIAQTSSELNISPGRISEYLLVASFFKTHPRVETFKKLQEAIDYCKDLKRKRFIGDI